MCIDHYRYCICHQEIQRVCVMRCVVRLSLFPLLPLSLFLSFLSPSSSPLFLSPSFSLLYTSFSLSLFSLYLFFSTSSSFLYFPLLSSPLHFLDREGRVMGIVEVSRSIGDGRFKRCGIISVPDVLRCHLTHNDRSVQWESFLVKKSQ